MEREKEVLYISQLERILMSIDALTAAISQLSSDVSALIAQGANSVPQAQVDAATSAVNSLDSTVKAVITPVTPPAV